MQDSQAARRLLLEQGHGVLSTISIDVPGYPFGSVTPYCVDSNCTPLIYISTIAQHTKNLIADPRVSLTVLESVTDSEDVQAQGRLTCLADACILPREDAARSKYFRYFPSARQYEETHDFEFFRLELVRIRYIGGFGRIFWLEPGDFRAANPFAPAQEQSILDHMNSDHADALRRMFDGKDAVMVGIDGEGFDVLAEGRKLRRTFDAPIHNLQEARQVLVDLARK